MKNLAAAATAIALSVLLPVPDAHAQDAADNVIHPGDAIPWGESSDGVRFVALFGDMNDEGAFVFRLEVQPGFELRPHTHPILEHITVLSGRLFVGVGETMDRGDAPGYGPGSYLAIAAGVPAYMWAEEETVLQIHGVGPMTTQFVAPGAG